MTRHIYIWALATCLIACASANGYDSPQSYSADAPAHDAADVAAADPPAASCQANEPNLPYQPVNTKGNTLTSSISYPQNKGEILIHRPAPIIVKRPPTKVLVNHPPLVVKPAPVVLHRPPAIVLRKVYVKHHPRRVKVEPVFVNVVKPPAEKYFVNENKQGYDYNAAATPAAPAAAYASGADSAAVNAGYQLLQGGSQGLSALTNLAVGGDAAYASAPASYDSAPPASYSSAPASYGSAPASYGSAPVGYDSAPAAPPTYQSPPAPADYQAAQAAY